MVGRPLRDLGFSSPQGIAEFFYKEGDPAWADSSWSRWPHLGLSMDLGPDGVCGVHALQRKPEWLANLTVWPDPGHGIHKDFDAALRGLGLQNLWLVLVISLNVQHGPDQEDGRHLQFHETMEAIMKQHTPRTCTLFREFAGRIHKELKHSGYQWPGEKDIEDEVWDYLHHRQTCRRKGRRIQLSRFLGSLKEATDAMKHWSIDCFERTYCALELDFLRGKKFEKLVLRGTEREEQEEGGATTSAVKVGFEQKTLRAVAANAVAISVMVLSDYGVRRTVLIITKAAQHLLSWHTEQARALRSAEACCAWMQAQADGEVVKHVWEGLAYLSSEKALEDCDFARPTKELPGVASNETAVEEDDYASFFGNFAVAIAFARLRRMAWLTSGWPVQLSRVLRGGQAERETVQRFRLDCMIYDRFRDMRDKTAADSKLFDRHLLSLTTNRQYRLGLERSEWKVTDEFRQVLMDKTSGMLSTQAVEDSFGEQKNARQVRGSKKHRRPERAFSILLQKKTLSTRHAYDEVP